MTDSISVQTTGHVAVVEMRRPPNNFFDEVLLFELADRLRALDDDPEVRSVVLCSEGKHFCAGAQLAGMTPNGIRRVYRHAFGLFTTRRSVVAAVQGSAVGGGLGLAWPPTSASPLLSPGSPPTLPASAFTRASACP